MSELEATEKGLQLVPKWWPVLMAAIALLTGGGASYAVLGTRVTSLEAKTAEQAQSIVNIQRDVTETKTDVKWIARALGKPEREIGGNSK